MRVRIIVDSTTDLAPELKGQVEIVPLTVSFGTEEYIDGITITHEEFYNRLIESDVLPTTSQATPAAFEKVFREVAAAGDSAVVITLASQLSGTSQSAPAHGTAGNGGHAGTTQRTQRGTAGHALLGGGHIGAGDARRHKGGHQDDRKQFFHKSLHNTQQRISS